MSGVSDGRGPDAIVTDGRALAVEGSRFAIATPHHAATGAGVAAIAEGGNAVDAALTAAVMLAVVYPHMCSTGGDLFAIVRTPDGSVTALNSSGAAPLGIDVAALRRAHGPMPEHGPLTITVPGAVAGWHALWKLGAVLPFPRAFGPGIVSARDGVAVAPSLAGSLAENAERLFGDAGMRRAFARDGYPLAEGDVLVQPELARSLDRIAAEGPDAMYHGDVGAAMVAGLRALGSPMTTDDLVQHRTDIGAPIAARYRGLDVAVVPPNSQGFALLQILRAIEASGIDADPIGPDAVRLAAAFDAVAKQRDAANADPRFVNVPVDALLADERIAALAGAATVPSATTVAPSRPTGDTIALVAADADGWAVSLIQSIYDGFGSGILEPSTGIILHNRGNAFSLDPASPNVLAPGKRPSHTLMPVLVHRDGALAAVSGSMGGGGQPQINAQNLIRVFDLGMTPEEAITAPRWLVGGMALNAGRWIDVEARVPEAVRRAFVAAGYEVNILEGVDEGVGHAHLIVRRDDGTFDVASDPRADGEAAAG